MLKVGKLYRCSEYFLSLFPDKEAAAASPQCGSADAGSAAAYASAWSRELGKPVIYAEKNIPLLVLNNREKYVEVLAGDRKGWIIFNDYLNIKEIVDEAA
jgi:hypothetical protein